MAVTKQLGIHDINLRLGLIFRTHCFHDTYYCEDDAFIYGVGSIKVGKVDANYVAQIEGYGGLLEEYRKKFEAVCAMLHPEELRLFG